jgi:hypothetical protein
MSEHDDATWVAKENTLIERVKGGGFAIALSGGGHRATLATLGALMAIVDRGLNQKVIQIASVSGGSITNAFVAQRCKFETLDHGGLDYIATKLATTIIRKGVLTPGWIVALLLVPVMVGTAVEEVCRLFLDIRASLAVTIGVCIALLLLIGRGLAVEWLLEYRYFRTDLAGLRLRGRAPLESLDGGDVDHVFCMTDLVLGLPVYASSQTGGMMWRRLKMDLSSDFWRVPAFQTFDASTLSIAELVRASAAFPGIPPRRLRVPPDQANLFVADSPSVAFLAHGGLWNNLGTQVMREDGFLGSYGERDASGIPRPYWSDRPADLPILCFNGSAPLRPSNPWIFTVPGLALLKALLQTTYILDANTVLPRVAAMQRAFERRALRNEPLRRGDPLNLVVDLMGVKETVERYRHGFSPEDLLPQPEPGTSMTGFARFEDLKALTDSVVWQGLIAGGTGRVDAATTLDRVSVDLARRLITRAYLNTYIASLFLAPLSESELARLGDLESRLDRIVGARTGSGAQ